MAVYEARIVLAQVEDFGKRIAAYGVNPELNDVGKAAGTARVRAEANNYRSTAYGLLKAERGRLGTEFQTRKAAFAASEERAAQKWNFERLNYHGRAIEARIKTLSAEDNLLSGTRSIDALRTEFNAALKSGDRHLARAWAELAPPLVLECFKGNQLNHEAELLAKTMSRELDKITWDADCQKAWDYMLELRGDALDFVRAADAATNFYDPNGFPYVTSEFVSLKQGITVDFYRENLLDIEPLAAPVGR